MLPSFMYEKDKGMNQGLLIFIYFVLDLFLLFGLSHFGYLEMVERDQSNISLLILALYVIGGNFLMAYLIFLPESVFAKKLLVRWLPDSLVGLGLLGTVIGMFLVFNNLFDNLDFSDIENTKEIVSQMANGFSVAVLTTITGMATNLLLNLKFVWFTGLKAAKNEA